MGKLLAFVLLAPSFVLAQTITLTPPTLRVDGSALPASQVANYEVTCTGWTPTAGARGTCTQFATQNITGSGASITGTVPASGGTAFFVVRTRDTAGLMSAASAEVSKIFVNTVPPNPPTNVTVAQVPGQNVSVVFKFLTLGARSDTVAGLVAVGKPCSGNVLFIYRKQSYRQVSDADVLWWPSVAKGVNVAAPCGAT